MPHGRGRVWIGRIGGGFLLAVLVVGGYGFLHWNELSARYAAHRLRTAGTDDERSVWAAKLVAMGEAGMPEVVAVLKGEHPEWCLPTTVAIRNHLDGLTPADPRFSVCCRPLVESIPNFSPAGSEAALDLVPDFLKCADAGAVPRCRELVQAGLGGKSPETRVRAVRLALRPEVRMLTEVVPLLDDPTPEVRRAAMLAVGPPIEDGQPVIEDEALFRWLHDSDPDVRELCETSLRARGLSEEHLDLARKLSNPSPSERLRLLLDLRWPGEAVRDPGPWLERLGRDSDPAVRAGALRVAYECRVSFGAWASRIASTDPDPTVRRLAEYYRGQAQELIRTGHTGD